MNARLKGHHVSEDTTTQEKYDFSTDPHGVTKEDILGEDFLLGILLDLNNGEFDDGQGSMNLTVAIDGVVISGIAVSAKEWWRRMSETLTAASEPLGTAFNTFSTSFAEKRLDQLKQRREEDRPLPAAPYVHMRDAHIIAGNTSQKFPLWRGKLSKLSGWAIGSVNPPEESKEY